MKLKKTRNSLLGITALLGTVFAISTVGYQIADTNRATLDSTLGTVSSKTVASTQENRYKSEYSSVEEVQKKAKEIGIEQGQEGTVVMKNDNDALPMTTKKVALFGGASYKPYMGNSDLQAGNDDAVDLVKALENHGIEVNATMKAVYDDILSKTTETKGTWGGTTITYDNLYKSSCGDMTPYQIMEINPADFGTKGYGNNANWKDGISKNDTIGIVTLARGVGEGNAYLPGVSYNSKGELVERDPLALSDDELALIDAAKESCSKVIVLLNTGNTMELSEIAKGGAHEVDAICYIGIPNDYHFTGIVDVLTGVVNATGALTDTYLKDNESLPAMQNYGGNLTAIDTEKYTTEEKAKLQKVYDKYDGGLFADASLTRSSVTADSRYPDTEIAESSASASSFGGGKNNYNTSHYIVEAEGIYVGYKYYETRYTDAMKGQGSANAKTGSSTGNNWNYDDEVIYPFGYGLSYLDYTQSIKSVNIDQTENGNVTAVISVTNNSDKDGKFLASLYVQVPYTEYDKKYFVEKSAVSFLNSAKVDVKAGETEDVTVTIPTKYLASYDYTHAKTYILDEGDYLFTAANGSHEAANNFLNATDITVSGTTAGKVEKKNIATQDTTTFSTSNGTKVTNVADDMDMNYWLPGTVTYLSRQDWDKTYPKNYLKETFKLADSSKKNEWIKALRGNCYDITETEEKVTNIDGADNGYKFNYEQLTTDVINDINNPYWDNLVNEIPVNEAVGAIIHGGSQSDTLSNIENPVVKQHEGVNGTTGSLSKTNAEGKSETIANTHFNISSQTLLGSTFNPELAYKWGRFLGDYSCNWFDNSYTAWGTGLTLRRTPYNGRNYEYISEDPMLTNRVGYGILKGTAEKGFMCGPKHMGFNDQEHNRNGVGVYINEQKFRETDLRGFEGGLSADEGGGLAVMIAFNRLGPTNAAHSTAMITKILRGEWGFTGIVSTDMMNNKYYFDGASMVAAGITQVADFAGNNSYISKTNNHTEGDSNWSYITVEKASKDANFVKMARQAMKYQLYTFAHTPLYNTAKTVSVTPWWDATIKAVSITSGVLMGVVAVSYVVLNFMARKED